jgi:hypothetical protein
MPTYAAYQQHQDGSWCRFGTFRAPSGSVRIVTAAFIRRYPQIDITRLAFARRLRIFGRYVDGERVQADNQ